jgi:hypothetical protein
MITPGNWMARLDEKAGIDVIEQKTGFGVVWIGTEKELNDCEYPIEMAKANAKLIAAAPKLLEFAIEMVNRYPNSPWIYEQGNNAINIAR